MNLFFSLFLLLKFMNSSDNIRSMCDRAAQNPKFRCYIKYLCARFKPIIFNEQLKNTPSYISEYKSRNENNETGLEYIMCWSPRTNR